MKSGGPWNLRGLRPDAREAARGAAQRSGMSVGEWLNSIIRSDNTPDKVPDNREFDREQPSHASGEPDRYREYKGGRDQDRDNRPEPPGEQDREWQRRFRPRHGKRNRERERNPEQGRDREREPNQPQNRVRQEGPVDPQNLAPEQGRERGLNRDHEQEPNRAQAFGRAQRRDQPRGGDGAEELAYRRESAQTREQLGDLHGRLDQLSNQIERLAHKNPLQRQQLAPDGEASNRPSAARDGPATAATPPAPAARLNDAPAPGRRSERPADRNRLRGNTGDVSVDQAIAEIAARQRMLDDVAPAMTELTARQRPVNVAAPTEPASGAAAPAPLSPWIAEAPPLTTFDLSGLERQLRDITARIEELRPTNELAKSIEAIRSDLAEIARQLKEALPRRAVEPLETEIKALAQRIDQSRQGGVDSNALTGLERGLAEVKEALQGLATSETLAGFDEAVKGLSQRLDLIAAKEDPAALQQLEAAIGALRGIVSHVASSDTLAKVEQDVRGLAATVDAISNGVVGSQALSALENRIDMLANAVTASTEAGHAVPRELEKLLSGLIDKLEGAQLTPTDHAALAHLEDRIATLVTRFDASDARLGHLEAIERGLADLLVHLDEIRGAKANSTAPQAPTAVDAIERELAEIKQSERRTQDSLEVFQGTVEQVVDRLATIERGIRFDAPAQQAPSTQMDAVPDAAPLQPAIETEPSAVATPAYRDTALQRATAQRPIDPNLPPDHPLEPGSASGRSRSAASPSERIAASAAAMAAAKPPVIPDPGGRSNFIAAARRAAQVAAATASEPQPKSSIARETRLSLPKRLTQHIRALLVAGSAVLIVLVGLRVASRFLENGAPTPSPVAPQISAPTVLPSDPTTFARPTTPDPAPVPDQSGAPDQAPTAPPSTTPSEPPSTKSGAATDANPAQQSSVSNSADQTATAVAAPAGAATGSPMWLWNAADITGSLPPKNTAAAATSENLPAGIGGPALRAAAKAGDPSAAYEVAMRFNEGQGVPKSDDEAARWLERAAKQGLALAQFRLGTFYEKGTGVKKDFVAARDLYLAAANKGNGKAMHNLAVLYAEGINGPADYRAAAHWFRMAADRGISDSQYNLGILYARGIGVDQSFADSFKWFALAANQGDQEAAKKRDEVAGKLDPQSLTQARVAVQAWSAESQPADAIKIKVPPGGWDKPAPSAQSSQAKPHPGGSKAAAPEAKLN